MSDMLYYSEMNKGIQIMNMSWTSASKRAVFVLPYDRHSAYIQS